MYRSALISIALAAAWACSGSGTKSASAANSNTTGSTTQASSSNVRTSDTSGGVAGPISTTDRSASGSEAGSGKREAGSVNPNRVPNEMGRIMVLEYHLITDHNGLYARERGQFRKDLELLYNRGYRPVNMADVLDKKLDLPKGLSPVVFVFDDASPEQFRYINNNGNLEIDPTSGIGIWLDFKKTHPDWSNKAVFCLLNGANAGHNFFGDRGIQGQLSQWRFKKVKWLADNGFELCDHTLWHAQLNKYSDAVVQEQIARNLMGIDSAVAGYKLRTMALPLGAWPKNRQLAWQGSWTNPKTGQVINYHFDAVLEVAGGPTRSPYDPAFNPHSISRVQATGSGVKDALDQLDKTKTRFVK